MRIIGKNIFVIDSRADFDRACELAYDMAVAAFGIDEFGHSSMVDLVRSTDSVHVKFLTMWHVGSMGGHEYTYKFEAWIEREG